MNMRSATGNHVHTKAAEVSVLHDDARRDAFDFTSHFREDLYMCLTRRGDTLFELVDAMLCEGTVTLLGMWLSDGVSERGGARFGACAQAVVGRPAAPVTCSQTAKRRVISAR
ncbi:hypothetical protein GCM10027162_35590 [Streptomyces incanus]